MVACITLRRVAVPYCQYQCDQPAAPTTNEQVAVAQLDAVRSAEGLARLGRSSASSIGCYRLCLAAHSAERAARSRPRG